MTNTPYLILDDETDDPRDREIAWRDELEVVLQGSAPGAVTLVSLQQRYATRLGRAWLAAVLEALQGEQKIEPVMLIGRRPAVRWIGPIPHPRSTRTPSRGRS